MRFLVVSMNSPEMDEWSLQTPVAFFVYKRPETTRRVFEQIRRAEPPVLFVIADGPRQGHPEEANQCSVVRDIATDVDWDCEVKTNFADENHGLLERFTTGLDWVFNHTERAIILEDDCLPNLHFFRFSEEMLERYADDDRILQVSGTNELESWKDTEQDYHFARHEAIWGWATWSRAWNHYDPEMALWEDPYVRERLSDVICSDERYKWRKRLYQQVFNEEIESWDYPWSFATDIQSGLAVTPAKNLVSNIGFEAQSATNTTNATDMRADIPTHELSFPLDHPSYVAVDAAFDEQVYRLRTDALERFMYRYIPTRLHINMSRIV